MRKVGRKLDFDLGKQTFLLGYNFHVPLIGSPWHCGGGGLVYISLRGFHNKLIVASVLTLTVPVIFCLTVSKESLLMESSELTVVSC